MLTITYPDVPGMVGKFGTILGDRGLNIARMEVGRSGRGQEAMIVLTLDEAVPPAVVEEIRTKVRITDIHSVTLG
jgi:D-3-phosphoglycerate dehydrogenase